MDIKSIREQHKFLVRWDYKWTPLDKGYTDKILYINVGTPEIKAKDVPPLMKEKFCGMQPVRIPNGTIRKMR
jgi:hypothetical protein